MAAENGALPRGKVGGIGDVIRDLPVALAERGWAPTVMTPAYGVFNDIPGAERRARIDVPFAGGRHTVDVYRIPGPDERVEHIALQHVLFSPQGRGIIYCDDGASNPFATDATKFALFCAAAAAYVNEGHLRPQIIHLHDWHSALFLALRAFDPGLAALKSIRTVFTIHNLALQGIRPLRGHESSLESWFPGLSYKTQSLIDPRHDDCVNPMAVALRLADKLSTVSPTYATEILQPNDPESGFFGGEGLEKELQAATRQSRLTGILNGCTYPDVSIRRPAWKTLRDAMLTTLHRWMSTETFVHSAHYFALTQLASQIKKKPPTLLLSIGRITPQKVGLFLERTQSGFSALELILKSLDLDDLFVMLGSGDPGLEQQLTRLGTEHRNFLFLKGYTPDLPDLLYAAGDLFLMPSTFEPCGVSQMLAMRAGEPCVVHGVGGLKDTVEHLRNGFVFGGNSPREQADNFAAMVADALAMKTGSETRWQAISKAAAAARFSWSDAAAAYERDLYASADA